MSFAKSPQNVLDLLNALKPVSDVESGNGVYQQVVFDVINQHCIDYSLNFFEISLSELLVLIDTARIVFDSLKP
jgi:hypothetical protein